MPLKVSYHTYVKEEYACEDRRCVFLPHAPPQQSSPRTAGPTAAFLHLPAPSLAPMRGQENGPGRACRSAVSTGARSVVGLAPLRSPGSRYGHGVTLFCCTSDTLNWLSHPASLF